MDIKKIFSMLLVLSFLFVGEFEGSVSAATVSSPNGRLCVDISLKDGRLFYDVSLDKKQVLFNSPLGLRTDICDFTQNLQEKNSTITTVSEDYTLDRCKKKDVHYEANRLMMELTVQGSRNNFSVEFQVSNNDIAFRYIIPRQGETGCIRVMEEMTGFRFPDGTTTFMCPQCDPMTGWKRSKPSYEESYRYDIPLNETRSRRGFTFPCLFKVNGLWVLVSETGTNSDYCGCRLSDLNEGNMFKIDFPMPEENNGNGTVEPGFALPGTTPWRTITVGDNLAPIVETTAPWNTVRPLYEPSQQYKYGKSTWSWIVWQDASMNYNDQVKYIDLAHELEYKYILIDAWWDRDIGYERMADLIKYAHSKKVDVFLWYSSSGYWNDISQSPVNKMDNPIRRKAEMRWMKEHGVKGIKVDFWGGDKQETMRLYEAILSDANDYGLMVIFHGCTIPRGWERMYPNYVGSEAVLASENVVFGQHAADREAKDTSTHPFIRNAVGCMEWGGSFLNTHLSRDNQHGTERKTTYCHEMAQAVLFQNPIQNFALAPNNILPESEGGAPEGCIDFMKRVPTEWTDTRFIDGYPGKYCVIARLGADGWWYIAGNNAEEDRTLTLDLSEIIHKMEMVTMYQDTDDGGVKMDYQKIKDQNKVTINIKKNGGFIIVR